jgi:hypothetical protein
MAKTNITGHGQEYCGTKYCKGENCAGAGNRIKTNKVLEYTSVLEAIQETVKQSDGQTIQPQLTFDEISASLDEAIKKSDKERLKQALFDFPGIGTLKVVTSGVFSAKEVDGLRKEGLIRLADMLRSPNLDPQIYSKLEKEIERESLGDDSIKSIIRRDCFKAMRANPKTPKNIIVNDLSENIPKLNQLMREQIEELKQHPLTAGLPNPIVEVIEKRISETSGAIAEAVKHPSLTSTDIPNIYRFGKTEEFFDSILENPNCSDEWINSIPEGRPVLVAKFLKHKALTEKNILKYSKSTKCEYRMAIAQNPSASESVIKELCEDSDKKVAQEAKKHLNAPSNFIGVQIDNLKEKRQSLLHEFDRFIADPSKDVVYEQEVIASYQRRIQEVDQAISARKLRLEVTAKDSATKALDDFFN